MKNSACSIGLVGLCLLKATLVWSLWCCGGGALAILGTGVLGLAQLQWPGRVNRGCGNKTRSWPPSRLLFSLSARGEGRNRTRLAFHKPLEINCLNHHCYLDSKGVCDLNQVNSSRLFLTPFYSPPMRFAGTSAGTFFAKISIRCH